jgi:hypothetical protein
MTMTLIETKTLLSAAAAIEFTSIPQDGTDLVVLISARSASSTETRLALNGSTLGFSRRDLRGDSVNLGASSAATDNYIGEMGASDATSNTFGSMNLYISNYTGLANKPYSVDTVNENNATSANQRILAGLWSNTAAITSLTISSGVPNIVAGSTISLYKITKGSDGITTVS